jgi:cell division protease FtsH
VRQVLDERRPLLEAITHRLMEREVLDGSEVKKIIEANSFSPSIVPGTDEASKHQITDDDPDDSIEVCSVS